MIYHFNVSGIARKNLVKAISKYTGAEAKYLGAPSFAYQVGEFTVSKDGAVSCEKDAAELITALEASGFRAEESEVNKEARGEDSVASATDGSIEETTSLSISLPRKMFNDIAVENLNNLLTAKGSLLKSAFQVESLELEIDEEKVTFPWFRLTDYNATNAYMVFIQKLGEMVVNQKRVRAKQKEIVNEKYEFRCFLLRLGMIGDEYKSARKILLKKLSGSSAFKNGNNVSGKVGAEQ